MYQDEQVVFSITPPAAGIVASFSNSIDITEGSDFAGLLPPLRSAPLITDGEPFMVRVDVTTAFTIGASIPVFQLHLALSDTPGLGGLNLVPIASIAPSQLQIAADAYAGSPIYNAIHVLQLALKDQFFLRPQVLVDSMVRYNFLGNPIDPRTLRYMGLVLSMPNYEANPTAFANGALKGYIIKDPTGYKVKQRLYPSGVTVK